MQVKLDKEFKVAFDKISKIKETLAPDILLKFYAFNKQANYGNNFRFQNSENLISGFKFNAWMQLKDMKPDKAKKEYIKLANTILKH